MNRTDAANEMMSVITVYMGHKCGWPASITCDEHGSCEDVQRMMALISQLVPEWKWRECPYIGLEARKPCLDGNEQK